jgi:hypothetical protein
MDRQSLVDLAANELDSYHKQNAQDMTIIMLAIEAIIQYLISNCASRLTPGQVKAPNAFQRFAFRVAANQAVRSYSKFENFSRTSALHYSGLAVDAILKAAPKASDEQVRYFLKGNNG